MKLLDYTGLTRLTANIKSYIASKLQPIDERTPFYSPALRLVLNAYFTSGTANDIFQHNTDATILTSSSTGEAKALYDRIAKGGFPTVIYADYTNRRIPFCLVDNPASLSPAVAIYRSPHIIKANVNQIRITISGSGTDLTVRLYQEWYEEPADTTTPLLPFHAKMYSVAADGTVSPSGTRSLSASSTGYELVFYNRIQQGLPPAIRVDITLSDGSTTRPAWLYLDTLAGSAGNSIYKSGELGNGTYSGKYLRLNINPSSMKVALNLINMPTA